MTICTTQLIYFSPTRTMQRVLTGIAQGIDMSDVIHLDLTPPGVRDRTFEVGVETIALLGAPVYSGRLPAEAVTRLQQVHGNNAPAVIVVVYGNRAYEDALRELCDLAVEAGFRPIAAAAFIGEHSYATAAQPIAVGRPDMADLEKAVAFGQQVRANLGQLSSLPEIQVPGNMPYKERHPPPADPPAPITITDLCTLCGDCADVCPTAAITVGDNVITDAQSCITCCACTRACPTGARVMEDPRVRKTATWLYENHSERKEPEIFIAGVWFSSERYSTIKQMYIKY
ncbi:MAG: 4Fe-4S binding protein [Anaerolineae bacterium]|nr:4Fe-4S binding protein [Anaerolineae bacterium]